MHAQLPLIAFVDRETHSDLAEIYSLGLGASPLKEAVDKLLNKKKSKAREEKRATAVKNAQAAQVALVDQTIAVQKQGASSATKVLIVGLAVAAGLVVLSELLGRGGGSKKGRRG